MDDAHPQDVLAREPAPPKPGLGQAEQAGSDARTPWMAGRAS